MSSVSSAMRLARRRRHELQRAHVVQAVGELDQENADVVGDRQQQLAQVLGLLGLARHQLQPLQLGEALDQRADLVAEHLVDFGAGGLGILDGVVQQRRDDGGVVELEVGEDRRDFERMRKIGIAGGAGLRAVRLHGVDIGAVQQVFVGVRIIGSDAFDQIVLPHHARARRLGRLGRRRRRRSRRRRHGDRIGRGLHLPGAAAPIRHRITASARASNAARFLHNLVRSRAEAAPRFGRERSISGIRTQSNAKPAGPPIKSKTAFAEFIRARDGRMVTMKTSIKAKARTNVRAFA